MLGARLAMVCTDSGVTVSRSGTSVTKPRLLVVCVLKLDCGDATLHSTASFDLCALPQAINVWYA